MLMDQKSIDSWITMSSHSRILKKFNYFNSIVVGKIRKLLKLSIWSTTYRHEITEYIQGFPYRIEKTKKTPKKNRENKKHLINNQSQQWQKRCVFFNFISFYNNDQQSIHPPSFWFAFTIQNALKKYPT